MVEMGEYLVGAYLKLILDCEILTYNQKLSEKQGEFDVLGIDVNHNIVYICEVITHIRGVLYGKSYKDTMNKIERKFKSNIKYAERIFPQYKKIYMLWSPVVPKGQMTKWLKSLPERLNKNNDEIKIIINEEYTKKTNELRAKAKKDTKDRGEPFYRALQILEHMR